MSEPYNQHSAVDNHAGSGPASPPGDDIPNSDSLQLGRSLLEESIRQLERLRQDYRQIHVLLERLWQQLGQRETLITLHLQEAIALLSRSQEDAAGDPAPDEGRAGELALRVQALGPFSVYLGQQVVPVGSSKKGRAIFRYLVTHPERRVARDVLLELFWPGEAPGRAGHKLHVAISALRQGLNEVLAGSYLGDCILFEEDAYGLDPAIQVDLDVDQFAARFRAGERLERENRVREAVQEYQAALALYQGDFLPEDLYADWAIAPRARMEEMYLTLLGRLANQYLQQGRHLEGISCCRQILARDSFREDAYRQLMRCYSRMGRRNQALQEFNACAEVLQRELGVLPMRETVELYERIAREEDV